MHASHFWGERGDWVGLMAVWGKSESVCCAAGSVGKGQGLGGGGRPRDIRCSSEHSRARKLVEKETRINKQTERAFGAQ